MRGIGKRRDGVRTNKRFVIVAAAPSSLELNKNPHRINNESQKHNERKLNVVTSLPHSNHAHTHTQTRTHTDKINS